MRWRCLCVVVVFALIGCGGPSEADIQATVGRSIEATAEAQKIATAIQATQEAEAGCNEQALQAYGKAIAKQLDRFASQAQLAGSTPRMSLGVPLQELLHIQNETEDLEAPTCLDWYHRWVVAVMNRYRDGYQKFAAQASDAEVNVILSTATDAFLEVQKQAQQIQIGQMVPTYTPIPTATPVPSATSRPPTLTPHAPYTPAVPTIEMPDQVIIQTDTMVRSEPNIEYDYVITRLCPKDTVAIVATQKLQDRTWGYIRVVSLGENCGSDRAKVGSEGWIPSIPRTSKQQKP